MIPSKHDHASDMLWTFWSAVCHRCGAKWQWTDRGWIVIEAGRG